MLSKLQGISEFQSNDGNSSWMNENMRFWGEYIRVKL